MSVNEKLSEIYGFLIENREYNKLVQQKIYNKVILPYSDPVDRIVSLLYHAANTQSQPRINSLALFFKNLYQSPDCMNTMANFLNIIKHQTIPNINYNGLFSELKEQKGWGNKTAALFTKMIFQIHNGDFSEKLKIWSDAPNSITDNDKLHLPVDTVIISIFNELEKDTKWNFTEINDTLKELSSEMKIEVWDDLWFWGFITQIGSGYHRKFRWNENKYWMLQESDKCPAKIQEIQEKANQFLKILGK
ncbi:MAG: hypothetical protein K1X81_07655 [Bacteroidia bacterium]|nr:hypothetical protein [Bacteroidia bacterium]